VELRQGAGVVTKDDPKNEWAVEKDGEISEVLEEKRL
jgi:hypothetical protein